MNENDLKVRVKDFWDVASCGEIYAAGESEQEYYDSQSKARYNLEPYIADFAKFVYGHDKDILEIGVGMGADHIEWAKSKPKSLTGIDLTPRAVDHTKKRLALYGLDSDIRVADTEELPFDDNSFDMVYSWGVLHHTPNTQKSIDEVFRVLRPGGIARIMIYHKYCLTGYMLWVRYGLLVGRPFRPLSDIYSHHLESPGTKSYSIRETHNMFSEFSRVDIKVQLSFGDLLQGAVGQRHRGVVLTLAKIFWPRPLLKKIFKRHGGILMIEANK